MIYNIEKHQAGKVYQYYPVQLTKWMSKNSLEQFLRTFTGYKRADIIIKGNGKGKKKVGTAWAVYIKKSNLQRRKEDEEIKMNLADFLLGRVICGRKQEGVSLLRRWTK